MYEGCSISSDLYLADLSRVFFEMHTMHHSKELLFTFMLMNVSFAFKYISF